LHVNSISTLKATPAVWVDLLSVQSIYIHKRRRGKLVDSFFKLALS
jgi:hypothetical protein